MSEPIPQMVSKEVVYEGRKVRLEVHRVRGPDGREAVREVVAHKGSVAVLAFRDAPRRGRTPFDKLTTSGGSAPAADGGREVLLERNYRYAVGGYVTEIPAGTLDRPDEPLLECAHRELQEETGCRAAALTELLTILPSPGFLGERLTVFVADEVEQGEAEPEAGELIRVVWTPWTEALEMIRRGEITDAKTVAAMLYYDRFGAASH